MNEFFREVGAKVSCPFCSGSEWVPPADKTEDPEILHSESSLINAAGDSTDLGVRQFPLTCGNCGFVRWQNLTSIKVWHMNKFPELYQADA